MIRAGPMGTRDPLGTDWDEKGHTSISHIYVSYSDNIITSIQFGYLNDGGQGSLFLSTKFGPSEGHNFKLVMLNQDEYVTGLSGELGPYGSGIKNVTFHTNRGVHGPIGSLKIDKFGTGSKIEISPGIRDRREFGDFFGSHNKCYLSSIGIYVSPIATSHTVVKRENM